MEWLRFGIGGAHPLPDPNAESIRRCESMGGGAVDPRLMLEAALSGRVRTIITGNDHSPHAHGGATVAANAGLGHYPPRWHRIYRCSPDAS
jgi:hypothetical protein